MKETRKQLEERIKRLEEELSAVRAREHRHKFMSNAFVSMPTAAVPLVPTPSKNYIVYGDGRCEEIK